MATQFRAERYRGYLRVLARVHLARAGPVRNKLEASDLVQDVLLQAHVAKGQFNGASAEEFAAWLQRILANKLVDAQRRFGRKKRDAALEGSLRETIGDSASRISTLPIADQTSPSQYVAKHERDLRLTNALDTLPEEQRTAVELRYLAGWSLPEIAKSMNRTKPSVAGLLRRGLQALRDELQALE